MRMFAAVFACLLAFAAPATAQTFPDRPITLVIPFAAGGSTDLVGRLVAEKMSEGLGQQVIVENKGGAGGNLGAATVAKAAPDGYTILMATVATHALNPAVYPNMPYDPVKDFAPISLLVTVPNVLIVHPSVPANTAQELIALLKANPVNTRTLRRGTARRCIYRANCSSSWRASMSCMCPTKARGRRWSM